MLNCGFLLNGMFNFIVSLTISLHIQQSELRKFYKDKKGKPLDLRKKLTRAKRRALTPSEKNVKSRKESMKMRTWPTRTYAVKA